MKFLLDTNICIGITRNTLPKTIAKVAHIRRENLFLCSIVRYELVFGIERCARPAEETRRVERLWQRFPSLEFNDKCADEAARIRAFLQSRGRMIGAYDIQIAAIARFHNLVLVTHDIDEFNRVPDLQIADWES